MFKLNDGRKGNVILKKWNGTHGPNISPGIVGDEILVANGVEVGGRVVVAGIVGVAGIVVVAGWVELGGDVVEGGTTNIK